MENIVFILGAGFSAPLGLPVVSNFIGKSYEMFAKDKSKCPHHESVYREINKMSHCKNFFASDLHSIEEVLSILEMQKQLSDDSSLGDFQRFIADVINHFTPKLDFAELDTWTAVDQFRYSQEGRSPFLKFILGTLGLEFDAPSKVVQVRPDHQFNVSFVTLNYDTVIEDAFSFIKREFAQLNAMLLPAIAKLHGCVSTPDTIVPPTWQKTVRTDGIVQAWKLAHERIHQADYIYFVGYSLPKNDAYIRYLLKAAILGTTLGKLKGIHIITRDTDGVTRDRYRELIDFPNCRFADVDISQFWHESVFALPNARNLSFIPKFSEFMEIHGTRLSS